MRHHRGFTLLELLAVVIVAIVIIFVALNTGGGPRSTPKVKSASQLAAITKSLTLYANTHNHEFPRLGVGTTTGDTASARLQELMASPDPWPPSIFISPNDNGKREYVGKGPLTTANFSYTLLTAKSPEWRDYDNPGAPITSDRLVGTGSLWNTMKWAGNVAWGDGHVRFLDAPTIATQMWDAAPPTGSSTQSSVITTQPARTVRPNDDIFSAADGGAMMEYN